MADAKIGSFVDLMKITDDAMQPIARRLREIIVAVDPEFVEVGSTEDAERAAVRTLIKKALRERKQALGR